MSVLPDALSAAAAALVGVKALFIALDGLLKDDNTDAVLRSRIERWYDDHQQSDLLRTLQSAARRARARMQAFSWCRTLLIGIGGVALAVILGLFADAWELGWSNLRLSVLDEGVKNFLMVAGIAAVPLFFAMLEIAKLELRALLGLSGRWLWLLVPATILVAYLVMWLLQFPFYWSLQEGQEPIGAWLDTVTEVGGVVAASLGTMQRLLLTIVTLSPVLLVTGLAMFVSVAATDRRLGSPLWKIIDRTLFQWGTKDHILASLGTWMGITAGVLTTLAKLL